MNTYTKPLWKYWLSDEENLHYAARKNWKSVCGAATTPYTCPDPSLAWQGQYFPSPEPAPGCWCVHVLELGSCVCHCELGVLCRALDPVPAILPSLGTAQGAAQQGTLSFDKVLLGNPAALLDHSFAQDLEQAKILFPGAWGCDPAQFPAAVSGPWAAGGYPASPTALTEALCWICQLKEHFSLAGDIACWPSCCPWSPSGIVISMNKMEEPAVSSYPLYFCLFLPAVVMPHK